MEKSIDIHIDIHSYHRYIDIYVYSYIDICLFVSHITSIPFCLNSSQLSSHILMVDTTYLMISLGMVDAIALRTLH